MGGIPMDPHTVTCLSCGEKSKVRVKILHALTATCDACGKRLVKEGIRFNDQGSKQHYDAWKIVYFFDLIYDIGFDDENVTDEDYETVNTISELCELIKKYGGQVDKVKDASMKHGVIAKIAHAVDWERIKDIPLIKINENERIERITADRFVGEMFDAGYDLYYTKDSILENVDSILNDERIFPPEHKELSSCNVAALGAYIGQSLIRLYGGSWLGMFSDTSPGANFYTSKIKIGEYEYNPSRYLGYRLSNGEEREGSFRSHIERIFIKIESQNT